MADIILVTTTSDSGAGSLRQALIVADSTTGADTIQFNIPDTDPGYNGTNGTWTIQPSEQFDKMIGDSTFINGASQSANQGDSNPSGPEIEIDGTNVEESCFIIEGSYNKISGLTINRFGYYGISIRYENAIGNIISGNYIGIDVTGEIALGNAMGGINVDGFTKGNLIGGLSPSERNIISGATFMGNIYTGNGITLRRAHNNTIIGNYIGTNKDGTVALGNVYYGILIALSEGNIIGGLEEGAGNVISGNGYGGIFIRFTESTDNTISGNFIGTDPTGELDLGNWPEGIYMDYGASYNTIGPQNIIRYNGNIGVRVKHDSTTGNRITQNSISSHGFGISLEEGGNNDLESPVIQEVTGSYVSGTACADCNVEIYSDSLDEGFIYEGSVTADGSGNFYWAGTASGPNVTALAMDALGNTSAFSDPAINDIEQITAAQLPHEFRLSQNYPNPFNPSTIINYELPITNDVDLSVYNLLGQKVAILVSEKLAAGRYQVEWDASGFASGVYFYRIQAGQFEDMKKMMLIL
jgi:hypothetical protein